MDVRWGLAALPELLAALNITRPLLITTARWSEMTLPGIDLPAARRFSSARAHAEVHGVQGARAKAEAEGADGLLALGGGSAIDTAKAVSSQTGLPVVSIPTTYSGAEWTPFFGSRDAGTGIKSAGSGAQTKGILYDESLSMGLPHLDSGGTALNALAHCAEALYTPRRTDQSDQDALAGAALIAEWLPVVLTNGHDPVARRHLLEGSMYGGSALRAGMGLGHAMAQALGGMFGVGHGPMNAICLPLALDFNRDAAAAAIARLATAMKTDDAALRAQHLAEMSGPVRLRDYGIAREKLADVAELTATRPAATSNPRPASPAQIRQLLESVW